MKDDKYLKKPTVHVEGSPAPLSELEKHIKKPTLIDLVKEFIPTTQDREK